MHSHTDAPCIMPCTPDGCTAQDANRSDASLHLGVSQHAARGNEMGGLQEDQSRTMVRLMGCAGGGGLMALPEGWGGLAGTPAYIRVCSQTPRMPRIQEGFSPRPNLASHAASCTLTGHSADYLGPLVILASSCSSEHSSCSTLQVSCLAFAPCMLMYIALSSRLWHQHIKRIPDALHLRKVFKHVMPFM